MADITLHYELDLEPASTWLTVTPSKSAKAALLHVQETGLFLARQQYYTSRQGLESYLIKYTRAGTGLLDYQGQTYAVQPGQLFWIDCREFQFYRTAPEAGFWQMAWVHFAGPAAALYYEAFLSQNRRCPVVTPPPDSHISGALGSLRDLCQTDAVSLAADLRANDLLTQILSEILHATRQDQLRGHVPESVLAARAYLTAHYAERITLEDLARRFSVSKFHFQKQFKHFTGATPNEFLLMLRLNRAKELLRSTDRSVSQIACDVGIQNVSHFIDLFRKQEGTTPACYRKAWPIPPW